MAFTPEDGTGLVNSNAYITLEYADSYHEDRGHASWGELDDDVKQACIVRATDYIDKRFAKKFLGTRQDNRQGLEWPRFSAVDDDGWLLEDVPVNIQKATAEYALRAAVYSELAPDPLLPVPTQDFTGDTLPEISTTGGPGDVAEISSKADIVEESIRYRGRQPKAGSVVSSGNIPEYPAADMLIQKVIETVRRIVRG
jgi:hypothetical protein